jgi:hypothetical protein
MRTRAQFSASSLDNEFASNYMGSLHATARQLRRLIMHKGLFRLLLLVVFGLISLPGLAQDARQFVQQVVNNELVKDEADHSHWLYFESDQKPDHPIKQWVAETANGSLRRVLQIDGQALSPEEQRQRLEAYLEDSSAQSKRRKGEEHDDKQAAEMLEMLPRAFIWTDREEKGRDIILHFKPDPNFHPPDLEERVFAAMEGDLVVDSAQHRIASLKGRLTQDVKILGGLLGELDAGGTFDVERRQTGESVWQITETHIHIHGHALIFHTISEQEDDLKTDFKPLPADMTMQQAKADLLSARH